MKSASFGALEATPVTAEEGGSSPPRPTKVRTMRTRARGCRYCGPVLLRPVHRPGTATGVSDPMLTEALIAFGLLLTRIVFRAPGGGGADLKAAMQEVHPGEEFDTAYRLLDNTTRAVGGLMAWIAGVVITVIPWSVFGTVFRATNPPLSSAIADVGGGVVAFEMAGFCLYLLRMGLAVSLARREANQGLARVRAALSSGQGGPSTVPPGGLVQLALIITRPTDFDFVLQTVIGILVVIALVNYAHTQGYPL